MVKSPLEYFEAQSFTDCAPETPPSVEEAAFIKKYLGVDAAGPVRGTTPPALTDGVREKGKTEEVPLSAEAALRQEDVVQLVGFTIGGKLYTIPTVLVQEVVRSLPIFRLPTTTACVSGAINLRGRVMPVIRLRDVFESSAPVEGGSDGFTIVCRCGGEEVGVLIDRIHSMYRVDRDDIQWDAAVRLGLGDDCIAGLFRLNERLVPIVSMEHIAETVLGK